MSLFLSVTAFMLSVAAVVVGAEALRRINGQNEEFLKTYVREIRKNLDDKDDQITTLRRELAALRANRSVSRQTLRDLEQKAARKRQIIAASDPGKGAEQFLPSLDRSKKRHIA